MDRTANFCKISKKQNELVSRRIAGETVIVPIRGRLADMQRIFMINAVAEYIWEQLDGIKSTGEILDGILAEFDVEKEQAEKDLETFIAELMEAGLVEETG